MLPTYIFITLLFTFGAFGKCLRDAYLPGSYSWRNRNVNIDSVCNEFAGDFSPNQFKTKCVEDKSGRRWDFELKVRPCPNASTCDFQDIWPYSAIK
ncbi:hypothetical protein CGMCC3_g8745 [Colletotrichum fructicola]|nr:uncharacterized protein CGMCC3_g8745 [Colletotrichum fructicola]KAE9575197.1 hypothetical protein CGMCC3_g8745 [Colletotrichum fructicola]